MKALVLIGASGVGKTTVAEALMAEYPEFSMVRSATTRPPRGDGRDGEYVYLTRDEFLGRIERSEMLEYTEFGGNMYGTPKSELERISANGGVPLMVLDLNGAVSLRDPVLSVDAVIVYIYEHLDVIESRLLSRLQKSAAGDISLVRDRMKINRDDYAALERLYPIFDAFVRNSDRAEARDEVYNIYRRALEGAQPDVETNKKTAERLVAMAK
ncbi:MAG: guanylate kinase [Clostridia bacterium]|nr:guanylate kinase [Clostridia bacterium]